MRLTRLRCGARALRVSTRGTVYVYWGGNLDTKAPGKHNALATYVFQPLAFGRDAISLPSDHAIWKLDVGAGTWAP